jgi:hypothetical protein
MRIQIPKRLQNEFEQRARQIYGKENVARAFIEALELWLAQHRQSLIAPERAVNDQAYRTLVGELDREHAGKWAVIADGKLQGIGDSLEQVAAFAPLADDRLVFQVGATRPQEVEFGWELSLA